VAVLDSDDAVHPGRMAAMIARAEAAGAEIAVDNVQVVREDGTPDDTMFPAGYLESLGEISLADYIAGNLVFESRFNLGYLKPIFCRRFLDENRLRYDEALRIGEDYDFLLRLMAKGLRLRLEPAALYRYRRHSASISHALRRDHLEAMLRADAAFEADHPALDPAARRALLARRRSLERALAYDEVVGRLKAGDLKGGLTRSLGAPQIWPLLTMPVTARVKRLAAWLQPADAAA
jgi:succinoglycan biosynthesis protein ExoO